MRADRLGHAPVAGLGHLELGQRVEPMGVVAGRDQDRLRREGLDRREQPRQPGVGERLVAAARRERHVVLAADGRGRFRARPRRRVPG